MVTLASVARRLNRSAPTLVRWAKAGEFPRFVLINNRKYVFEADVARWLEARRAAVTRDAPVLMEATR
jgi:predicted site-specific integrase-resolvase